MFGHHTTNGIFVCLIGILIMPYALPEKQNAPFKNFTIEGNVVHLNVPLLTEDTWVDGFRRYPCYISVKTFLTPELKRDVEDVSVDVLTRKDGTYIGYHSSKTNENGVACVLSLCYNDAVIIATKNIDKLYASSTQEIPWVYDFKMQTNNEEIVLESVLDLQDPFGSGPVYALQDHPNCLVADSENHFAFQYSYLSIQDKHTTTLPKDVYRKELSWYPVGTTSFSHKACYIKIKMRVVSYSSTVSVESLKSETGESFGVFTTGPKSNPLSDDLSVRAACAEYRCSGQDPWTNEDSVTNIDVNINNPDGMTCNMSHISENLDGVVETENGFRLTVRIGDNYGENQGIFEANSATLAKSFCYFGSSNYPDGEPPEMDPETAFAVEYNCLPST